jgi:hypothetical protein
MRRYGNAIRSKPIILKAITDINAGNIEQNQIDSDKFDLQEREFKRGYPESLRIKSLPIKNYHKEWYDFEADSVMICL